MFLEKTSCVFFLLANGILSTLEQARADGDEELNVQIDDFFEEQKRDEEEFFGHFDPSNNQAVCQAILLQVCYQCFFFFVFFYC